MASMISSSSAALSPAIQVKGRQRLQQLNPSNVSFQGLRPLTLPRSVSNAKRVAKARVGALQIKAELNPSLVISLSTGLSLFLGRFVFFNFQRENVAKQVPEQNGLTHFEAGDTRAKEYVSLLKSNDPVGFNIVDVLAWGSIGHIVAYYILATTSNGYDPSFFG
ncbi:hypothetical protein L6164_030713 [Bauhinia variegata]|uniref:Uncharacterized protein n=1 Tax=Bauhinia variegata TaxID=167791 RepID=A0ACB9LDJ1_BAUVA|nr:hypothetical protein L6164_030713 [Bauhinia variegata]